MREEKTEGVVLKAFDYKEKERIISLFTPDGGLISLIVKGISDKSYRLLLLTTPFCRGEYIYTKGRSDLYRFCDGAALEEHLGLRQRLSHLQAAGALAAALLKSQLPGKPAPLLYALFSAYLAQITSFEDPSNLVASFYLKLLHHEGILPEEMAVSPLLSVRTFQELRALLPAPQLLTNARNLFNSSY